MNTKFSLRQMLLATIVFAALSAILGLASRGSLVAYGLGVALLGLIVPAMVFTGIYWLAKLSSRSHEAPTEFHSPVFGPDELSN